MEAYARLLADDYLETGPDGGMARNVIRALDLAAAGLAAGGPVPEEAEALMGRPLMPRWIYNLAANWGFRRLLKKHGARSKAYDRPFAG